ncbi:MAG: hypothetical protein NTZ49_03500 [Candidatus Parcubacteria bacterium]|nr:hypothetical protein [Candidatus Parcubacteria bacterium]
MLKALKIIVLSLILILTCVSFVNAGPCEDEYLQGYATCAADCRTLGSDFQSNPAEGLCQTGESCCYKALGTKTAEPVQMELQVPIFENARIYSMSQYFGELYKYGLIVLVSLAIVMVIIGGVSWILSAGNPTKVTTAKAYIISAFSGLIIGLFSYIMLSLVGITELKDPSLKYIEPMRAGSESIFFGDKVITLDEAQQLLPKEERANVDENYEPLFANGPSTYIDTNSDIASDDQQPLPFISVAQAKNKPGCLAAEAGKYGKCGADGTGTEGGCCKDKKESNVDCTKDGCIAGYCGKPHSTDKNVVCVVPGKPTNPKTKGDYCLEDMDNDPNNGVVKLRMSFSFYYRPKPYPSDKGYSKSFWCNSGKNCLCPTDGKPHDCCPEFTEAQYANLCRLTAIGTQPRANITVAASQKCFKKKCSFKVLDASGKAVGGGHLFSIEDNGGAIKGNRIDLFLGDGPISDARARDEYGLVSDKTFHTIEIADDCVLKQGE